MPRQRYSPRFTGFGKQFLEQAAKRDAAEVTIPPVLREKLKEEMGITDADIDVAIEEGKLQFREELNEVLTEQEEELASLKESIKDEQSLDTPTSSDDPTVEEKENDEQ